MINYIKGPCGLEYFETESLWFEMWQFGRLRFAPLVDASINKITSKTTPKLLSHLFSGDFHQFVIHHLNLQIHI